MAKGLQELPRARKFFSVIADITTDAAACRDSGWLVKYSFTTSISCSSLVPFSKHPLLAVASGSITPRLHLR
jgi:hypothetical protein